MKSPAIRLAIAFVLGLVVGMAALRCSLSYRFSHIGGDAAPQRLLKRFSASLHLTPEQQQRVGVMLESKRQRMDALRAEVWPRFDGIRASTSAEIRALLTPEQQQQFDVMDAEFESRRRQMRERWSAGTGKP